MSLTRRRFTQILASTLFLHHLPSFAQSVKFWSSLTLPEAQNITRIVSAGAPGESSQPGELANVLWQWN
ncbi:hypothetical protein QU973_09625 [Escherichia coli]|nr:hypothetical protein [Escherichia coli]